jgi:hypothetical protein
MTQTKATATVLEQANRTIQSTQRRDLVGTILRNSAHGRLSFTTCGLLANAIHAEVVKPLETERDALLSEVTELRKALALTRAEVDAAEKYQAALLSHEPPLQEVRAVLSLTADRCDPKHGHCWCCKDLTDDKSPHGEFCQRARALMSKLEVRP